MGQTVEYKFVVTVRVGSRDWPQPDAEAIASALEREFGTDGVEVEECDDAEAEG